MSVEDFYGLPFIRKKKHDHNYNNNKTFYKENLVTAIFQPVHEIINSI